MKISKEKAYLLGLYYDVNFNLTPFEEWVNGLNIELEHKLVTHGDPFKTAQIALAHIEEFPRYYKELVKMEKRLKK